MVSYWFSYSLLSLVNEKWSFNFVLVSRDKFSAKKLYCADDRMDGWMDRWLDGWTVIKSALRFSLFWCVLNIVYICTHNMYSNVVTKRLMSFKIWCQAEGDRPKFQYYRWLVNSLVLCLNCYFRNTPMRITVFCWQQPVHTSLRFSPFGDQRKPYTNARTKRASGTGSCSWMGVCVCERVYGDLKGLSIFLII